MNQKGFATLEVILMVMVIGILATVAVPRFDNITAKANTAKILSDLATIDSAIAIQQMESSDNPTTSSVAPYLNDGKMPEAPKGKAFLKETTEAQAISGEYLIEDGRAKLNVGNSKHAASDFSLKPKKSE